MMNKHIFDKIKHGKAILIAAGVVVAIIVLPGYQQ